MEKKYSKTKFENFPELLIYYFVPGKISPGLRVN